MAIETSVVVTSKITTPEQARAAMLDTIKNPPRSPVEMVSWLGKNLDVSGALSSTGLGSVVASAFPLVGGAFSLLSGIFDAFSSGPSIGQITLDAIQGVSMQIDALGKELTATIERVSEKQTIKTTDLVLSGVDDVARQMSAAAQIADMIKSNHAQEFEKQRLAVYSEYLADELNLRKSEMDKLKTMLQTAQAKIQADYENALAQLSLIGIDLLPMLFDAMSQPQGRAVSDKATTASPTLPGATQEKIASEKDNGLIFVAIAAGVGGLFFLMRSKKR